MSLQRAHDTNRLAWLLISLFDRRQQNSRKVQDFLALSQWLDKKKTLFLTKPVVFVRSLGVQEEHYILPGFPTGGCDCESVTYDLPVDIYIHFYFSPHVFQILHVELWALKRKKPKQRILYLG